MINLKTKIRSRFAIRLSALLLAASAFLTPAPATQAADVVWNNINSSYYDIGSNWIGSNAPSPTDTALFNSPNTYQAWWDQTTVNQTPSVGFVRVTDGNVTFLNQDNSAQHLFNINGSGQYTDFSVSGPSTLNIQGIHVQNVDGGAELLNGATLNIDGSHVVGSQVTLSQHMQADGSLNITNGGILNDFLSVIGRIPGANGFANVSDIGSTWNNTGAIYTGYQGHGDLSIKNGGFLNSGGGSIAGGIGGLPTSSGLVIVDDATWNNSSTLYVGYLGNGELMIKNNATVTNQTASIAQIQGSTGLVTVTGQNSKWINSNLHVGHHSNGTLNVNDGAVVTSATGYIGTNPTSQGFVTITGLNSAWNNSSDLFVGYYGQATLNIENGATVSNANAILGQEVNSQATVNVTGTGSTWNNTGNLNIGLQETSSVNITDRAIVNVTGTSTIDNSSQLNADVLNIGSTNLLDPSLSQINTSNLIIQGGSTVNTDYVSLESQGTPTNITITGNNSTLNVSKWMQLFGTDILQPGTLNILDGAKVTTREAYTGVTSNSFATITIDGQNAQWMINQNLYVGEGNSSNTDINIQNQANLTNLNAYIAYEQNSNVTVNVNGQNTSWINNQNLHLGQAGHATLFILDQANVSNVNAHIATQAGSTATITVDNATWNNSGDLNISTQGDATLYIQNAAIVSAKQTFIGSQTSTAGNVIVNITGQNTQLNTQDYLAIGGLNNTTLTIEDNATINTTGHTQISRMTTVDLMGDINVGSTNVIDTQRAQLSTTNTLNVNRGATLNSQSGYIGYDEYDQGQTTVIGNGTTWNNSNSIVVGYYGIGTLNILDKATVNAVSSSIGEGNSGIGTVNVNNAIWNNSRDLYVGIYGQGVLNIEAEAVVTSRNGVIGYDNISFGLVNLTGSESRWTNSLELHVGYGSLYITEGAAASSDMVIIGAQAGLVTVNNATLTNNTIHVGFFGTGTLNIQNGGLVTTEGTTSINALSTLNINHATLQTGSLSNLGTINIQLPPESLGGASADHREAPLIIINNNLDLAGTLNIELLDGELMLPGETFDFITYTTRTGSFNQITSTNAPLGLFFDILFDDIEGTGTLQAQAHLPGDANLDGTVNIQDLALLASNFNNSGDWFAGNFNTDSIINIQDLAVLASNFNNTVIPNPISSNLLSANSIGGASVIPTPSSLALLALSSLTLLKRRRKP